MTKTTSNKLPGQVVLVMQGGGALGAFQAGVYEAMHEAGIEPDWVVGTSIGAINGAIIAGNKPANRIDRLREFWQQVRPAPIHHPIYGVLLAWVTWFTTWVRCRRVSPDFSRPTYRRFGAQAPFGITNASFYKTAALRDTLERLVNFGLISQGNTRLTLGAVNVESDGCATLTAVKMPWDSIMPRFRSCQAASFSRRRNRWRALLGCRYLLQHAD